MAYFHGCDPVILLLTGMILQEICSFFPPKITAGLPGTLYPLLKHCIVPENQWLEDLNVLLGWPIFRGYVSFRDGIHLKFLPLFFYFDVIFLSHFWFPKTAKISLCFQSDRNIFFVFEKADCQWEKWSRGLGRS